MASSNDDAFALLAGPKGPGGGKVQQKRCLSCGNYSPVSRRVCVDCGGPLSTSETREVEARSTLPVTYSTVSRGVYVLLAILVGGWGVHNFYARRNGVGAAQLIVGILVGMVGAIANATGALALSWVWLLGAVALLAWIVKDIVTVRHDGRDLPFARPGVNE